MAVDGEYLFDGGSLILCSEPSYQWTIWRVLCFGKGDLCWLCWDEWGRHRCMLGTYCIMKLALWNDSIFCPNHHSSNKCTNSPIKMWRAQFRGKCTGQQQYTPISPTHRLGVEYGELLLLYGSSKCCKNFHWFEWATQRPELLLVTTDRRFTSQLSIKPYN